MRQTTLPTEQSLLSLSSPALESNPVVVFHFLRMMMASLGAPAVLWLCATIVVTLVAPGVHGLAKCYGSDCVIYDLNTQANCKEVTSSATYDCRWAAGLDTNVDMLILKGDIVAYQIQWFSGSWTNWFVSGVNDIDIKFNPSGRTCAVSYKANTMRRLWSYFYDHTHKYIICTSP